MHRYLYVIILLVIGCTLIVLLLNGVIGAKEIATAFLALVGTFVGALFAFRLNESKEARKLEKDRKAALNRALFITLRQYNAVSSYAKTIQPFTSEFERAFNCPAVAPPPYGDLKLNFSELDFLLESPEPGVLMRLSIEEEGFHQTIESIRVRNDVYVKEVQPAIDKTGLNKKTVTVSEAQTALGERIFGSAMNTSRYMYENVADAQKNLRSVHSELFALAKRLFPQAKFIKAPPEGERVV